MSDRERIENAIRHIQTSTDIDPWAMNIAVDAMNAQLLEDNVRGKWEIYVISPFDGEDVRCSECGQRSCLPNWNFCPNCGADMRGEKD